MDQGSHPMKWHNHNGHEQLLPQAHEQERQNGAKLIKSTQKTSDDELVASLRRNIDIVRMNLSAEIAELRQRKSAIEEQISRLAPIVVGIVTVVTTISGILAFFGKNRQQKSSFLKGLALQAGLFAAQRGWQYYRTRVAPVKQAKPKLLLLPGRGQGAAENRLISQDRPPENPGM